MKSNVEQLVEGIVSDNTQFINGNVAEYLLNNAENMEFGWYEFLTTEEIEEFENDSKRQEELIAEVTEFINDNFNYEMKDDDEEEEEQTYDIRFDDEQDSESKSFSENLEYCKMYIKTNNSSNDETFKKYKGGTATIVCNETEEDIETITIQ